MYFRPAGLTQALEALAARPLVVLAGGTDFFPARVGRPIHEDILDVSRLSELRIIREQESDWRIGALSTWTDVIDARLPAFFDGLKLAAREVGGVQIQNAGTVAGNLCNASAAADGIAALMALDAEVELASADESRRIPITAFVAGNRKTIRRSNELVTAVLIPKWRPSARSTFLKLGSRKYLVISIAIVAAALETDSGNKVTRAGIAVGACSPVARRLRPLEDKLIGQTQSSDLADLALPEDLAVLSPIDDIRGSARYRNDAALTLVKRALKELAHE